MSEIGGSAQIFDRGYRRYDGPRTGVRGALRSLVIHSSRSVLGMGRPARSKAIPVLTIVFAYLPAIAFIGMAAVLPENLRAEGILPTYASYYGYVIAAIYLFASFLAPQILCTDRRTGLLGVYLASPLSRPLYLVGKALTALLLLLTVTLGPPLLMLLAFSLESAGPDGFVDWITVLFHIVVSSIVMGVLFTALALGISAATDRSMVASAAIALLLPGSAVITDLLVYEANFSPLLHVANLSNLPRELIFRIHGEGGSEASLWPPSEVATIWLWTAWLVIVLTSLSFLWVQYRRLLVRR
ncbi:MAG: ABC transporter permease subunit [Actinomycetota bacterium]|nr:ABC transporter permease subunit [Actinomycetota bacterium]